MAEYLKPVPVPDQESQLFWLGCKKRELLIQRCRACDVYQYYPRALCMRCLGTDIEWVRVSGRGTIYSYTVTYQNASPGFSSEVPYVLALVDLDVGVRMMTNIVGAKLEELHIGAPVQVVFEDISPAIALPKFRLAGA
jgi:uncharacterized OB-fold protein